MADSSPFPQTAKVIARAWSDPAYKARLIADPAAAIQEAGGTPTPGVQIKIVENTPSVMYFVLPATPDDEFKEETLSKIADFGWTGKLCSCGACITCLAG
jgi:Nitrile hydratase, alpha chain